MERLTKWIDDGENRWAIPDPEIRSNGHGKCCNKLAELGRPGRTGKASTVAVQGIRGTGRKT